jgi:signal transduction histidine kinase
VTLNINKTRFNLKLLNAIEDTKLKVWPERSNKVKLEFKNRDKAGGELVSNSDDIFVEADRDRMIQVISNLLDNALKFTCDGLVSVGIARKMEKKDWLEKEDEKVVVVSVEDTGSGIDPEIYPRLFTKFSSKSFSGTGLGLYISKSIIEAHGGKIWAQNDNGHGKSGATFSFSLPLYLTPRSS